jgi:hypothetical protein
VSSEPQTQEAEEPVAPSWAAEYESHEHKVIILCRSGDDADDTLVYGPFEDDKWAEAWIKQHNNDPYFGTEDEQDERIADEDHWCMNDCYDHWITKMWVPGFDPTTLPQPVE